MRIFELSTRLSPISRGDGRSATSAAAYRAGVEIVCEREDRTHDYTRKRGVLFTEIVLPGAAPAWMRDRGRLWNAAELVERNGGRGKNAGAFKANAKTARDLMFSLPNELSPAGRIEAARIIAAHLTAQHGVAVDLALHAPGREGDQRNFHCHMLMTVRRVTADGLGEKTRELDDLKTGPKITKALRAFIAKTLNDALAAEGKAAAVKVEHRSFQERGSGQQPTKHLGPTKTHAKRKAQRQEREAWAAEMKALIEERQAAEVKALQARHQFQTVQDAAKFARREREAAEEVERGLAELKARDAAPAGLRKWFLRATGLEMRDTFNRAQRHAVLERQARDRLAAIRAELAEEAKAAGATRTAELARVTAKYAQARAELQTTIRQREAMERAAERAERQNQARPREGGRGLEMTI